jgi:hypothetical protein
MAKTDRQPTPGGDAEHLVERRLIDLERVCRGLSHEANNWLYTVLGQLEMADQHMQQMTLALRYADRVARRVEQTDGPLAEALPVATIAALRQKLPRRTMKRRLEGLRKARQNAARLAEVLHMLHMFAAGRDSTAVVVDLNEAARAATELVRLGYYRSHQAAPPITLTLAEGLPLGIGSLGLAIGIIIDLTASLTGEAVALTTRYTAETVVCEVAITPGSSAGHAPALAAATSCGGQLTVEQDGAATIFRLSLPLAGPL